MKRYGFARALLPGLLCFVGSAMYDESNTAPVVQWLENRRLRGWFWIRY